MSEARAGRWTSILRERCARCRSGQMFGGLLHMNPTCPECGVAFEREPGYFFGAMYLSYGLGVAAVAPVCVVLYYLTQMTVEWIGIIAGLELLVLSPWLFRYSRVLWIHFDDAFDPV